MDNLKALVINSFNSTSSTEISVKAGEFVTVLVNGKDSAFCLNGNGDRGYVPKIFLKIYDENELDDPNDEDDSNSSGRNNGMRRIYDTLVTNELAHAVVNQQLNKVGPPKKKEYVKHQAEGASSELSNLFRRFNKSNENTSPESSPEPIRPSSPTSASPRRLSQPIEPSYKKEEPKKEEFKPSAIGMENNGEFRRPTRPTRPSHMKSTQPVEKKQPKPTQEQAAVHTQSKPTQPVQERPASAQPRYKQPVLNQQPSSPITHDLSSGELQKEDKKKENGFNVNALKPIKTVYGSDDKQQNDIYIPKGIPLNRDIQSNQREVKPNSQPMQRDIKPNSQPMQREVKPNLQPMQREVKPNSQPMQRDIKPNSQPMQREVKPNSQPMQRNVQSNQQPMQRDIKPNQQPSVIPNQQTAYAVLLYPFTYSDSRTLPCQKGEIVVVNLTASPPDWYIATNARGETGLIPRNRCALRNPLFVC